MQYDVQIFLPPFPDAFSIGVIEESFSADCRVYQLSDPSRFLGGQPFLYNSGPATAAAAKDADTSASMKACMSSLETYLSGVFSLMENMDDHLAEISSDDLLAAMAAHDGEGEDDSLSAWRTNRINGLEKFLSGLGKLIGSFLRASDLQDVLELRRSTEVVTGSLDMSCDRVASSPSSSSLAQLRKRRPCWYPHATEGLRLQLQIHDEQVEAIPFLAGSHP